MKNTKFYVREKCGNVLTTTAGSDITCCNTKLLPLDSKEADEKHMINVKIIEDDFHNYSNSR